MNLAHVPRCRVSRSMIITQVEVELCRKTLQFPNASGYSMKNACIQMELYVSKIHRQR